MAFILDLKPINITATKIRILKKELGLEEQDIVNKKIARNIKINNKRISTNRNKFQTD